LFENRVLRRIFGPMKDTVTGQWRKLLNLVICTPHPVIWGNQIDKNKMGGACSTYGGEESCVQGFGGET
jgi:hypothetical protein